MALFNDGRGALWRFLITVAAHFGAFGRGALWRFKIAFAAHYGTFKLRSRRIMAPLPDGRGALRRF